MNIKLTVLATIGMISFTFANNLSAMEDKEDKQVMEQEERVVQLPDVHVMKPSVVKRNPTATINEEENINYTRNINHHRNIFNQNHTHMHKTYNHRLTNNHKHFTKVHNRFSQSASASSTYNVSDTHEVMPTEEVNSDVVSNVVVNSHCPYYANNVFCHPFYAGRFVRLCRGF